MPSIKTNAGIPLSKANWICDLCESLGANDNVKRSSASKNPPKLATWKYVNQFVKLDKNIEILFEWKMTYRHLLSW